MGDVYRALDQHTGRPVALKTILIDDARLVERFKNEARALVELNHPAIVKYVADGEAPGQGRYLAMEWLDGVTLSERLTASPLDVDESLALVARVADGL